MALQTSGTYGFSPSGGDLLTEAFGRIGIRPSAITPEQIYEARLSANFILQDWANRGVNLWAVDLITIPLIQGTTTYNVPSNTVMILDSVVRLYQLGSPQNVAPAFATTSSSATVTVTLDNAGLSVGSYLQIVVPVSIGGIVLLGYYQATSIIDNNTFTLSAADSATATASGGVVPVFTTGGGSGTVTVTLPNHGLLAGDTFPIQVSTMVGGLVLAGDYTVSTIVDADNFTITSPVVASTSASASENNGNAQIAVQVQNTNPTDIVIQPMSRTEYNGLPNKFEQGRPTSLWFDRLAFTPTVTLWPVPDQNGPYEFRAYRMRTIQDFNVFESQTPDMPGRMLNAFASEFAYRLGIKYPPDPKSGRDLNTLKTLAIADWSSAAAEDRERVPLRLQPDFSGYTT